jgi:hypothetical protein
MIFPGTKKEEELETEEHRPGLEHEQDHDSSSFLEEVRKFPQMLSVFNSCYMYNYHTSSCSRIVAQCILPLERNLQTLVDEHLKILVCVIQSIIFS